MKLTPYWLDTTPSFAGVEGKLEGSADVVVVGGGFTGLSAALALAKKGANVTLVEADRIGGCASGRNGGMCNNGFAQDYWTLSQKLGAETAKRLYQSYDRAVDTVERIIAEERIDCNFARVGKLKLAAKPAHYDALARSQELLAREVDPDTELVAKANLRDEVGCDQFYGGLLFKKSAAMHMGKFAKGLADAASRRGVRIYQGAPMLQLKQLPGGGHEIGTPKGTVRARQVLLATGTSAVGPLSHYRRRIVPVGAFIIATEPLSAATLDRVLPRRRNAVDTKNFVRYFRVLPDDRLLFGGRARFAASSEVSDAKSGRILERSMLELFPELSGVRIDYCWGGMVDMTADRLPRAGEHDGVYFAMGYSGHGTQMSTYMGGVMAQVMDGNAAANPWRGFDWPAIKLYSGKPWFLPLVGAYYRLKDVLQ